jgi:hypothetical protein
VFVGTGTAGAYHAGVLRALLEAGVRVDVVAGRGMGAMTAMLAAVDAGARLWDASGTWRGRPGAHGLYPWRSSWRVMGIALIAAAALLALPVAMLLLLALAYPFLLAVSLMWPAAGTGAMASWREATTIVSGPEMLGSLIPRLVTGAVLVAAVTAAALYVAAWRRHPARRRSAGAVWWRVLGAPFDAERTVAWAAGGFWHFMRGATHIAQPPPNDLSRRYAEMLGENLGQPGYRELVILAHDLDSRRDVVFALLADPWRKRFAARAAHDGAGELVDLAGTGRIHVIDALGAALSPPLMCEPRSLAFALDSFWRGETHRLCDRPSAVTRLLREVASAGVTQAIVVSAAPPLTAPHALTRPDVNLRQRVGDVIAAVEASSLGDAQVAMERRFRSFFSIRLAHNPVGPFDFEGRDDRRSDRRVALEELVERGYEDAYRQFVDPVIGASGEQIHGVTVVGPTPQPENMPLAAADAGGDVTVPVADAGD